MLMRWPARWRRPLRFVGDVAILALVGYLGVFAYLYAYQVDLVFRPPPHGSLVARSLAIDPQRVILPGGDGLSTEAWRIGAAGGRARTGCSSCMATRPQSA